MPTSPRFVGKNEIPVSAALGESRTPGPWPADHQRAEPEGRSGFLRGGFALVDPSLPPAPVLRLVLAQRHNPSGEGQLLVSCKHCDETPEGFLRILSMRRSSSVGQHLLAAGQAMSPGPGTEQRSGLAPL